MTNLYRSAAQEIETKDQQSTGTGDVLLNRNIQINVGWGVDRAGGEVTGKVEGLHHLI